MEKHHAVSYHERKLKALQSHLDQGTFPKNLRLKTPEGQALLHEACEEVRKMMLIQMVKEQQQCLAQAKKEVQSLPKDIKSLQKELKSLRTRLRKLQTSSAANQVKRRPTEPEDTPKQTVNSTEIET